ncbi:hypothetical protein Trydic_g1612 [Trypoxylus dichotomus]
MRTNGVELHKKRPIRNGSRKSGMDNRTCLAKETSSVCLDKRLREKITHIESRWRWYSSLFSRCVKPVSNSSDRSGTRQETTILSIWCLGGCTLTLARNSGEKRTKAGARRRIYDGRIEEEGAMMVDDDQLAHSSCGRWN